MNITLIGAMAIFVLAALGYFRGLYKIVAALVSFFLAALLAKPFSVSLIWLVVRSKGVPQALAPLTGQLLAGLFLFLLFDLCAGRLLRKREENRARASRPRIARWERVGGAVLGTVWGLFLVIFVLIGVRLIGNVEEVLSQPTPTTVEKERTPAVPPAPAQPVPVTAEKAAAPKAPAPSPKAPAPPEVKFVALKNQIERSFFGAVVKKADPVGDRITGIFQNLTIIVNNPNLYSEFTRHPGIARFVKDPQIMALSEDKQIQQQLSRKQYYELLDNARIASLLKDDVLLRELKNVNIGEILEKVIANNASLYSPAPGEKLLSKCPNCLGSDGQYKDLYRTEQEASRMTLIILKTNGRTLQTYPCPFGNGWHLRKSP